MSRGIIEAQTLRSEQFEFEARTSDPGDAQPGEYWIRVDQTSTNPDVIAELRRQDASGVTTCPIFAASEQSNLGTDVTRGPSVVLDDGSVGFVAMTTKGGAVGSPRAVTSAGAQYVSHDALELNPIPDSGLVHEWPFDEGIGDTVTDTEGGNDGTVNGATWTTTAKTGGQALSFDGTDDYVGGIDSLTEFSAASIVAWIRPAAIGSGPYTPLMRGGSNVDFGVSLVDNSGDGDYDDLRFIWRDGGFNDAFADDQAAADTWLMVAHTVDSSNGFDGYVNDGTNVASASSSSISYAGLASLEMGRSTVNSRYFDGIIDQVFYYDRKLAASEVSDIYSATV